MKILDAHAHLGWDTGNLKKNLVPSLQSAHTLLQKMQNSGIEKAVIMPFPTPKAAFNEKLTWFEFENAHVINTAKTHSSLIPFLGVHPGNVKSVESVTRMIDLYKIKGVKLLHQNALQFSTENLIGNPFMETVQKQKVLFMIHIGTGKEKESQYYHGSLPYAMQVAEAYPKINFIFSHLGRLHEQTLEALQYKNVYMDTSGISLHPHNVFLALEEHELLAEYSLSRVFEYLIDQGFAEKLVWGSDEPYTDYNNELVYLNEAELPEKTKQKILYTTMAGLLGLP